MIQKQNKAGHGAEKPPALAKTSQKALNTSVLFLKYTMIKEG